jgi:hypothetical protein
MDKRRIRRCKRGKMLEKLLSGEQKEERTDRRKRLNGRTEFKVDSTPFSDGSSDFQTSRKQI